MIEFAVGMLAGALFGYALGGLGRKNKQREAILHEREERFRRLLGGG